MPTPCAHETGRSQASCAAQGDVCAMRGPAWTNGRTLMRAGSTTAPDLPPAQQRSHSGVQVRPTDSHVRLQTHGRAEPLRRSCTTCSTTRCAACHQHQHRSPGVWHIRRRHATRVTAPGVTCTRELRDAQAPNNPTPEHTHAHNHISAARSSARWLHTHLATPVAATSRPHGPPGRPTALRELATTAASPRSAPGLQQQQHQQQRAQNSTCSSTGRGHTCGL
jgi:hypothetical protein